MRPSLSLSTGSLLGEAKEAPHPVVMPRLPCLAGAAVARALPPSPVRICGRASAARAGETFSGRFRKKSRTSTTGIQPAGASRALDLVILTGPAKSGGSYRLSAGGSDLLLRSDRWRSATCGALDIKFVGNRPGDVRSGRPPLSMRQAGGRDLRRGPYHGDPGVFAPRPGASSAAPASPIRADRSLGGLSSRPAGSMTDGAAISCGPAPRGRRPARLTTGPSRSLNLVLTRSARRQGAPAATGRRTPHCRRRRRR